MAGHSEIRLKAPPPGTGMEKALRAELPAPLEPSPNPSISPDSDLDILAAWRCLHAGFPGCHCDFFQPAIHRPNSAITPARPLQQCPVPAMTLQARGAALGEPGLQVLEDHGPAVGLPRRG